MRVSSFHTTAHVGAGDHPDYLNAALVGETALSARDLLTRLLEVERTLGRVRTVQDAPRTLDLDVLFYGDARMDSPRLQLPHPRWASRAFVLHPLRDVCPERVSDAMLADVSGQRIERL